ncbi:hypothetical protein K402DRAFT_322670 [Aulographum hederae CBS 113979]|uniref:Fumarylacetoacetase-like C-terminal domain-containing protein n=1 Tax=Aulographum hederae CBS 113979 TaxID=1176131 RepID=A0A6G1HEU5_9PEZI|nr:hypothetical protein K402DRAFT_322670 [Aulographum hederae CBS 113979]
MPLPWKRLIRFVSTEGKILRGEPILPSPDFDLGFATEKDGLKAKVISGDDIYDTTGKTKVTDEVVTVKEILGPLAQEDVPVIRCIGLNYAKHIREAGRTPPPFPSVFFKPPTCINDHNGTITIPTICQDSQADYEGEFCFIIGADTKNASLATALGAIAAYTCGNDVSSRKYQRNPELAGGVPQWGFSKGFDGYAPLGPCLLSAEEVEDPKALRMKTVVDGETRQEEGMDDLLFDCAYLVWYMSQGTTLKKGTVVMTGTPGGVGFGMKPQRWLVPGTQIDISVTKIGTLRNTVEFAKEP